MRRHRAYCTALAASTGFRGICTVHAMPQIPSGMQPYLPRMPYARFHRIQRAAICIHPHYAHTRHAYSASACSRRIPHLRGAMRITLSDHQNIIVNAGLPTAYGINQHIKIAFVLLLVPTVACWYAFLGSGLRGEQSYSPARPMVFRRGTPSIFKELLSGFSFAIAQPALLWFVIRPMLAVNGASALMLEDGMPLLAYGIGTVCCVVAFAISCCVAPCTFGTFRHVPRGGYAIDQATNAVKVSHEPSGFSIASVLEIAQTLFDDCLR